MGSPKKQGPGRIEGRDKGDFRAEGKEDGAREGI